MKLIPGSRTNLDPIPAAIGFDASTAVRKALSEVGRTEDITLSPSGSLLAMAAFAKNKVYIFSISTGKLTRNISIEIIDYTVLASDRLNQPHGCTFLDDEHLFVCSRMGDATIFRVPTPNHRMGELRDPPLLVIPGSGYLTAKVKTPGSVVAFPVGTKRFRCLVCNDQWHFVTAHTVDINEHPKLINEGKLIEEALEIPDGIALSPDRRWIAISNHVSGEVLIYPNTRGLDKRTPPVARLGGIICPHGIDFDNDGNIYVADASSPYLHLFERPSSGWRSITKPNLSVRLMDNDSFYAGRYSTREGGIKGIGIDRKSGLLLTTCKSEVIAFHDLSLIRTTETEVDSEQLKALAIGRDLAIARKKPIVLSRRWDLPTRLRRAIGAAKQRESLKTNAKKASSKLAEISFYNRNRLSRCSLVDDSGPIVCLTSHSERIASVYLTLESIGLGKLRPSRLILWLSDKEEPRQLPDTLSRLRKRGLEIRFTPDRGPHTKYYAFLENGEPLDRPIVTADDDVYYDESWLETLMQANLRNPSIIHCHRARRIQLNAFHFEPYEDWPDSSSTEGSHLNFLLGVSGVVYPPQFLLSLKSIGDAFVGTCYRADDVWINHMALRTGFSVAQVSSCSKRYPSTRSSRIDPLSQSNLAGGDNQLQLARTYTAKDRELLRGLQEQVG